MRVSKIIPAPYLSKSLNKRHEKTSGENTIAQKYFNNIIPPYITFGADKTFAQTLKENYFKLPKGCFPDNFQIEAGKALNDGRDVIVEAPTGTGKTAIAHYAVARNMEKGKTTFYTTPLKALSNQKTDEFRKIYGADNVGILTGDRRENTQAPIIIMTTEVYRNMALSNMYGERNPMMENLGTVILDEFHYLGDIDRGSVWEESLMYTPKDVQTLSLSATIGNPNAIKNWIKSIDGNNAVLVSVPAEERNVPLKFDMLETSAYEFEDRQISNSLKKKGYYTEKQDYRYSKPVLSDFKSAVEKLRQEEKLPAIFFVFSKKFSRDLLDYFVKEGKDLTTPEEKQEIKKIVNEYKQKHYMGADLNTEALEKGYAIHNAGIIPSQKQLIEELFQRKLLKTVIATETLAAGINMPAKTVVISSPYKPTDENKNKDGEDELNIRLLTPNEFKQMSGRAGRRGIDKEGFVYTMPTDKKSEQEFIMLEVLPNNPLESRYEPDYAFLAGFYEHNSDMTGLNDIYGKTFYAYSDNNEKKNERISELTELTKKKTKVLKERDFITEDNGQIGLTTKGCMASKVRGYDALTLTEVIEKGAFKDITPEVLASIAGAMANQAKGFEGEIDELTDIGEIIQPIDDYAERVYNTLKSQIRTKLKKLDINPDKFETYQEMIKEAEAMEQPEKSEAELSEGLKKEEKRRAKMYKIMAQSGSYTLQSLADAIRNGKTVPSRVLENYMYQVNHYKNRIHTKDIDAYIEKLESEYKSKDTTGRGNKAKARLEKEKEEVKQKISQAKLMKYLDENIENVLAENQAFMKKNPPSEVKRAYNQASLEYNRLTLKDGLISDIKAIMSIDDYLRSHNLETESDLDKKQAEECLREIINTSKDVRQSELKNEINTSAPRYGRNVAEGMYLWAFLNKINTGSMNNWQEIINNISEESIDEGTIYRMTMQTADLLSQIGEIAVAGAKSTTDIDKIEYYNNLRKTAAEARRLIIREPVEI